MPVRKFDIPEDRSVHSVPVREVTMVPPEPTAANGVPDVGEVTLQR
jgi:hypothetical protein